ncbi:OLC1v1010557C1 [Oldenlandia corymbosa var. corymbosa]|uniref:OLC1v1010557C1 n=1 Tax=Oldenlandia corymbosa var. corymbosa TaxID=529605 RepID=A0AAV1DRL4_OLDCO|nr:OLC1v1010557C1 [Oldenlandia corymbosa var. corymbosa]
MAMGARNCQLIRLSTIFSTAVRYFAKKPKPKMKPIELNTPPEQTQTITRAIFDILKEHGPLTVNETWDRVKEVGLRGLSSKRHMKIILRWMRERQRLRIICNHVGPQKQFLYTTWFTNPNITNTTRQGKSSSHPKLP